MKIFKKIPVLFLLLFVSCAPTVTGYKPAKGAGTTGYIDRKVADGEYEIQIKGNAHTTFPTLEIYFHRRAGELCGSPDYTFELSKENTMYIVDGFQTAYMYQPSVAATAPFIKGKVKCKV